MSLTPQPQLGSAREQEDPLVGALVCVEGGALDAALEPHPGTGLALHPGGCVEPALVTDGVWHKGVLAGVLLDVIEVHDLARVTLERR